MRQQGEDNTVQDDNVYLGLGSNLGDRSAHVRAGLAGLCEGGLRLRAVSSLYLTEPDLRPTATGPCRPDSAGEPDRAGAEARRTSHRHQAPGASAAGAADTAHPDYVNCVAAFDAGLEPRALLDLCLAVERRQGRERSPGSPTGPQPRTLDIDVLLIGQRVVDEPGLKVPHPLMMQRRFVLEPLAEIAPSLRHPLVPGTIGDALARLPVDQDVTVLEPPPAGVI